MAVEIIRSSHVDASPEEVWASVSTFSGVNAELRPFVVMRGPAALRGRTLESFAPGERATCTMLAGGILPFDRHHLGFESVTPGSGFVEESTSWVQRRWRHERTVEPDGDGTKVTDRVTAEPRVGFAAPVVRAVVGRLFTHRHRRLVRSFSAAHEAEAAKWTSAKVHPLVEQDLAFVDLAPGLAQASIEVGATREQVWAVLVDHRRWPDWFGPSLLACEPTSEAEAGVGSTRRVRLKGGAVVAERFIAWDEPSLWSFTGTGARPKVFSSLVERATLDELPGGRTRVTYTMAFALPGALGRLAPLVAKAITRNLAGALAGLARRAEGGRRR